MKTNSGSFAVHPCVLDSRIEHDLQLEPGINWSVVLSLVFNFGIWLLVVAGVMAIFD